jgi:hypothetical protein
MAMRRFRGSGLGEQGEVCKELPKFWCGVCAFRCMASCWRLPMLWRRSQSTPFAHRCPSTSWTLQVRCLLLNEAELRLECRVRSAPQIRTCITWLYSQGLSAHMSFLCVSVPSCFGHRFHGSVGSCWCLLCRATQRRSNAVYTCPRSF